MTVRTILLAFAVGFYFAVVWSLPTAFGQDNAYLRWIAKNPDLRFPGEQVWTVDIELLRRVNVDVNRSMTYRAEPADRWESGSDCEDYAIAKLRALLELGVPRGALRFVEIQLPNGSPRHIVLMVNNKYILDNRMNSVERVETYNRLNLIRKWEDAPHWLPLRLDDVLILAQ